MGGVQSISEPIADKTVGPVRPQVCVKLGEAGTDSGTCKEQECGIAGNSGVRTPVAKKRRGAPRVGGARKLAAPPTPSERGENEVLKPRPFDWHEGTLTPDVSLVPPGVEWLPSGFGDSRARVISGVGACPARCRNK